MGVDSEYNFLAKYLEIWLADAESTLFTGLSTILYFEY